MIFLYLFMALLFLNVCISNIVDISSEMKDEKNISLGVIYIGSLFATISAPFKLLLDMIVTPYVILKVLSFKLIVYIMFNIKHDYVMNNHYKNLLASIDIIPRSPIGALFVTFILRYTNFISKKKTVKNEDYTDIFRKFV